MGAVVPSVRFHFSRWSRVVRAFADYSLRQILLESIGHPATAIVLKGAAADCTSRQTFSFSATSFLNEVHCHRQM